MPLLRHRVHEESFYECGVATCYCYAQLLVLQNVLLTSDPKKGCKTTTT